MAKNISSRSTRQIQGGLATAVRTLKDELAVVPARFAPYSPEELYQRFLVVMPDHKGNLSSTCGEYGRGLDVDVSFDFGDLILPGFSSLDVSAGAKGDLLAVALLIIHRTSPRQLAGLSASAPARWDGNKPVCFLSMSGKKQVLTLKLGANLELGNSIDLGTGGGGNSPESLGLALNLSAQMTANLQLKGQLMHLKETAPGWYLTGNDAGLQTDFKTVLGPAGKKALKQEIVDWYEYILELAAQQLASENKASLDAVKKELSVLNGGLGLEDQLKALAADQATDQIKNLVGEVVANEPALSALQQMVDYARGKLDQVTTSDLLADLKNLETFYINYARNSTIAKIQLQQIKDQIAWYTNSLTTAKAQEAKPTALPPKTGSIAGLKRPYQQLSYLSVFSFIPSADGLITGTAQATLNADGSISGEKVAANASAKATGTVTANGQIGLTSYRYQTFALSAKGIPLVSTQDTELCYRQAQLNASVLANLDAGGELSDYGLEKGFFKEIGTGKEANYNMLTYRSVQMFWQYHAGLVAGTASTDSVSMESGSGLSFGCSVSFLKLVRIARQLAGTDPLVQKDKDLLANLAKQLRVKLADMKAFLTAASIGDLGDSELAAYTGIILESNHAFLPNTDSTAKAVDTKINVKRRSNSFFSSNKGVSLYDLPDMLSHQWVKDALTDLKNPEAPGTISVLKPALVAIRLRVRLADHSENSKTLFQLGFKVAAGLNVALNKIESVGNESVLDVYTHWFGPYTAYNQSNQTDAYEQSVPAVALLHQ